MRRLILEFFTIAAIALLALPAVAGAAVGYSKQQILEEARILAQMAGLSHSNTNELVRNLETALNSPEFSEATQFQSVQGIFVFHVAEGNVISRQMSGEGLLSFRPMGTVERIYLRSRSSGVPATGGRLWGVGLVIGLQDRSDLGGGYSSDMRPAVAIDEAIHDQALVATYKTDEAQNAHQIFMVLPANGMASRFAGSKLIITPPRTGIIPFER